MPLDYTTAQEMGVCPECEGRGDIEEYIDLSYDDCPYCDGYNNGYGNTCDDDCPVCNGGISFYDDVPCQDCNGKGTWSEFERRDELMDVFYALRPKYPDLTIRDVFAGTFSIRDYWLR